MWDVRGQILTAAEDEGIRIRQLPADQVQHGIEGIRTRFANGKRAVAMWENLQDGYGVQDPDSWRWVGEFVADRPSILFFEEYEWAFEVPSGPDLVNLLGQTFDVEFCVTDSELSYLFFFNHHDCLLAAGAAAAWLKSRA